MINDEQDIRICISHSTKIFYAIIFLTYPFLVMLFMYALGYFKLLNTSDPLHREIFFYLYDVKIPIIKTITIIFMLVVPTPTIYPPAFQALIGKKCYVAIIGEDIFVNGAKAMAITDLKGYDIVTKLKNFRKSVKLYLYKNDGTYVSCYFAFEETQADFRQNMDAAINHHSV